MIQKKKKLITVRKWERCGYNDNGQVKKNLGTIMKPEYVWFGSYYKYEIKKV